MWMALSLWLWFGFDQWEALAGESRVWLGRERSQSIYILGSLPAGLQWVGCAPCQVALGKPLLSIGFGNQFSSHPFWGANDFMLLQAPRCHPWLLSPSPAHTIVKSPFMKLFSITQFECHLFPAGTQADTYGHFQSQHTVSFWYLG